MALLETIYLFGNKTICLNFKPKLKQEAWYKNEMIFFLIMYFLIFKVCFCFTQEILVCWIPSHNAIKENEKADLAAKST